MANVEGMTNDEVRSGARSNLGIPSSFLIRISPFGVIRNSPMKSLRYALFLFPAIALSAEQSASSFPQFDAAAAERFAKLALECVGKQYPNKISHVLNSDADVAPPRKLTPAFYGCYDWHSSVHGHWLLVRLVRTFPDGPFAKPARTF